MEQVINTKELRASLPEIVRRVRRGERFLVLYRSRPAFRLLPPAEGDLIAETPLEEDPIYRMPGLGSTKDGLTSKDHDEVLYGWKKR